MSTRVLIADNHALVRRGLCSLLGEIAGLELVGEATNGPEAVQLAEQLRPDLAIIDVSLKGLNGIEAIAQAHRISPATSIIALSMSGEEQFVMRAVKAGAKAYVLKDCPGEDVIQAIRAVLEGQSFFSAPVAKIVLDAYARGLEGVAVEDKYELLTTREREIYQMLAEGKTNKIIAEELGLKMHTVETHRLRVMNKLDVHNMAQLVLSAVRRGVVA